MKQRISYYTMLASVMLICATGCSKEDTDNTPAGPEEPAAGNTGVNVQFTAGLGAETRTSHESDGKTPEGFVVKWKGYDANQTTYDKVGIVCFKDKNGNASMVNNARNVPYRPTMSGTTSLLEADGVDVSGLNVGNTYNFYSYYPYVMFMHANESVYVPDLSIQKQANPDNNTHLGTYDFLVARQEGVTIESATDPLPVNFKYKHLFTSLQFNVTNGRSTPVKINKITLAKQDGSKLKVKVGYNLLVASDNSLANDVAALQLSITDPLDLAAGSTQKFWMMMDPTSITAGIRLKISIEMTVADGVNCTYTLEKVAPTEGFKQGGNYTLKLEIPDETDVLTAGEQLSAYEIYNAAGIVWLSGRVTSKNATFEGKTIKLTEDIDMQGIEWTAIGNEDNPFKGNFDGQHYKINNLTISRDLIFFAGLFGQVQDAAIRNVHVVNGKNDVAGEFNGSAAGICGSATNSIISGCSYEGEIGSEKDTVGGIVGSARKNTVIIGCKYSGSITVSSEGNFTGGIVGCVTGDGVTVTACYSDATLVNNQVMPRVGGIVGFIIKVQSSITACYYTGEISANGSDWAKIGSICGWYYQAPDPTIIDCYTKTKGMGGVKSSDTFFDGVIQFGDGDAWPSSTQDAAWIAGPGADGTLNLYWKNLGSWNDGVHPVYPRLWWE